MQSTIVETGAGYLGLGWTGAGVVFLHLPAPTLYDAEMEMSPDLEKRWSGSSPAEKLAGSSFSPESLARDLQAYFEGIPVDLAYPVDWSGYTDFQRKVLQRVYTIPRGEVLSYGQVGAEIGNPRGARAVGGAVGSNRAPLIVPCHRVIAHGGSIGGFGCGLDWKKRLLDIEGIKLLSR